MQRPTECLKRWHRIISIVLLLVAVSPLAAGSSASRRVLVLGDSLSAGYGLAAGQGWVDLLAQRLAEQTPPWSVINASVSGETTAGGGSRLPQALQTHQPQLLIVELGANDGLRGLPLDAAEANLRRIVAMAQQEKVHVLLLGMRIPPNYGPDYSEAFAAMYRRVAQSSGAALLPFLLEPLGTERDAFQDDGLHPVAAAQPRLLEHVWTALQPLLQAGASAQ